MGIQYEVNDHTFENRRESVIFYDGFWYDEKAEAMLFGDSDASQTVEMDKKYLALILAYFDQPGKRTLFGLEELIEGAKKNLRSFEYGESGKG